jgi:hypothetical protein
MELTRLNENDTDNQLESLIEYFTTGEVDPVHQLQNTTSDDHRLEGQVIVYRTLAQAKIS